MDCVFNQMILGTAKLHIAGFDHDVSETASGRKGESLGEMMCSLPKLSTKPHSNIKYM